jgi:hypothetical protein
LNGFAVRNATVNRTTFCVIDLGTGSPTYGTDSSGDGTVTGTNGSTYAFNPVRDYLRAQWSNLSHDIPIVQPAPIYETAATHNNPMYAYSHSSLLQMNENGLAVGIDLYGVDGHTGNTIAFLTQLQANGTWGTPIALWSGRATHGGGAIPTLSILGISSNGQVLGYGVDNPALDDQINYLYYYDIKSQMKININTVIGSMGGGHAQLDDDGRVLVQAYHGYQEDPHNLLLVPNGVSADPLAVPEPATWAVFATMIVGAMAHKRIRSRRRPPLSDSSRLL